MKNSGLITLGMCIFLGLTSLGYFVYNGIVDIKALERTVVVKGLAEQDVMADQVVWPIIFNVTGHTLEELYASNTANVEKIIHFLTENGVAVEEISVLLPMIDDKTVYASEGNRPIFNYSAVSTVTVNSHKVALISEITEKITILLKDNVALTSSNGDIRYVFTKLNELKPQMIEDATTNAREVAEKFAKDSQSFLGKIREAHQGQFSITTPDRYKPQIKQVRVVSTIEYYLVD